MVMEMLVHKHSSCVNVIINHFSGHVCNKCISDPQQTILGFLFLFQHAFNDPSLPMRITEQQN